MSITYGPDVPATFDTSELRIKPQEIVDYARTWIGVRWRHQGRGNGPRRFIDCAGLMIRIMAHFGMAHQDAFGYTKQPCPEFITQVEKQTLPTVMNTHTVGAWAIFSDGLMPCHLGIMSKRNGQHAIIHSECYPKMSTHESLYDMGTPSMKARIVDVRLFPGVAYV